MKTAIVTFVYSAAECYLTELADSLQAQTDGDFDVLVFSDGFENAARFFSRFRGGNDVRRVSGPFAAIRKLGIKAAVAARYDLAIFADADDVLDSRRVEVAKRLAADGAQIVFNELELFGSVGKRRLWRGRFREGERVGSEQILRGNCLGMGNTAVRLSTEISDAALEVEDTSPAFDWAFYTRVLRCGVQAVFTNLTRTHYRQHVGNVASVADFTDSRIRRGVFVKARHYSTLTSQGESYAHLAADFDGGQISSDGGLVLLRQVEYRHHRRHQI